MLFDDEPSIEEAKDEVRKASSIYGFGWLACHLLIAIMIKLNRLESKINNGEKNQ